MQTLWRQFLRFSLPKLYICFPSTPSSSSSINRSISLITRDMGSSTMTQGQGQSVVLYFGYGSNMSVERILANNPNAVFKTIGKLQGYQLEFNKYSESVRWGGASANIIPVQDRASSHVYGVIWELPNLDLDNLDRQEGVGNGIYERTYVNVESNDGTLYECLVYQMTEKTRSDSIAACGLNQMPSKIYKSYLIRGAIEHRIPAEYVTFLQNIPDNGFNGPVNLVKASESR